MEKLLIAVLSPRDMPNFTLAINKINHDKIWVKYTGYNKDPYGQWLQFFHDNPEYTHVAICPDDLIIHPFGVSQLWETAKTGKVVSAVCNVDKKTFDCPYRTSWDIAASKNLPTLKLPRDYDWWTWGELQRAAGDNDLYQVKHTGAAFLILPRDIVEKLHFKGDLGYVETNKPSAYDVGISNDLNNLGIPQYLHVKVFFAHFRYGSEIMNNKKEPCLWIDKIGEERETKSLYDIVPFCR